MEGKNTLPGRVANPAVPGREARLFHALLKDSSVAFAYLDKAFNFVYVSQAFARPMNRDAGDLAGKNYFDIFPYDDGDALLRSIELSRARPFSGEAIFGGNVLPICGQDGVVEGVLLVRDGGARASSGQHGTRAEVLPRQTQSSSVLNWRFDIKAGRFVDVSADASALLGYSEDTWRMPGFLEHHLHPDDRESVMQLFLVQALDGQVHDLPHRFIAADGAVVWVRHRLHRDEKGAGMLRGQMLEITADQQAEKVVDGGDRASAQVKAGLAVIFNAIPDAAIYTDCERRIVMANSGVTAVFGYAVEELAGHAIDMLYAEPASTFKEMGGSGGSEVQPICERLYRRKNGAAFIGETMASPMHDTEGRHLGDIAFIRDVTVREHHQEELNRLKSTLDRTLDCIFMFEPQTLRFFYCNEGAIKQVGYTTQELLNMTAVQIKPQLDETAFRRLVAPLMDGSKDSLTFETVLRAKDGHDVPVEIFLQYIAPKNEMPRFMAIVRDTTERRQAEARMRKLSMALEQTADSICITDRSGMIEYVNPAFEAVTGYNKQETVGRKISILNSGRHNDAFYKRLWNTILSGEVFRDIVINRKKDGTLYYEEETITPLKNEFGEVTHFVSAGKDITERVETQNRLQYLAHHDVLTGLPNRTLLLDRVEHALARTHEGGAKLAVLFLDLDRFKIINDTLGHGAGDRLLQLLADRFMKSLRDRDTIARLSGDEFAILMEDINTSEQMASLARSLLADLAEPFVIEDRDFFITASIGISVAPGDGADAQAMLKHAETAMYRAKDFGRNTYQFYSADMSTKAFERLSLETSLRYALERDQFVLYYQPQVDIASGNVIGVEALLRWQHPDLGLVSPADFIPILEETGLIMPVGEWILYTACRDATRLCSGDRDHIRMSVNLSARQFSDAGLIDSMQRLLRETGLAPEHLEIEITESVIMQDDRWALRAFDAIRDMNVHLAIDDFGTGYSSLAYLKRFPIDTLKIDRTFVRDIIYDPDDAAIVRAIIAMAESLKLRIIAEGVETLDQLKFLQSTGCGIAQGYFYSPPVVVDAVRLFLDGNAPRLNGA